MRDEGTSYKYTVNFDNNNVSCSSYNIYYTNDYTGMEVTVRYQNAENETSTKETNRTEKEE